MNIVSQYIIQMGISENILTLILSIPIILVIISLLRRVIGFKTFGLYVPLILIILISIIGLKAWIYLFIIILFSMIIARFFLKKIKFLSVVDSMVLNSLVFYCVLFAALLISLVLLKFKMLTEFNILTLLAIFFIGEYTERLLKIWESKKFKDFLESLFETLLLIIGSYFLISLSFVKNILLNHPIEVVIISIILILLLVRWRAIKIKELREFKEIIKHVESSPKKQSDSRKK